MSTSIFLACLFFFGSVLGYFICADHAEDPSTEYVLLKFLPIASLKAFVIMHAINVGKVTSYAVGILMGLVVSSLGDYCMVYKKTHFYHALGIFAVVQIIYTITFGFKQMKPKALLLCIVIASCLFLYLYPGLDDILLVVIAFYMGLLTLMAWRAIARWNIFDGTWTWAQCLCAVGALSFCVSDFLIAVHKFRHDVPLRDVVVMVTYFVAQFGIAVSVIDFPAKTEPAKKVN